MSYYTRSRVSSAVYSPLIENGYEITNDDEGGPRRSTRADYETAIAATEYGKFHYWLLLACGWANAADAVEILCVSFLLPSAECDLLLTSTDKGILSAIVFLGMMIGGYLWGGLGDSLGRRGVLMVSMTVNAIFGMLSSLAMTFPTFLVLRFLSGLGIGGSIPVTWSYYAEFQPKAKRGAMLSFLAAFWMVGNLVVAGLAWAIIPLTFEYESANFQFNSWRLFTLLCGIPSLSVAITLIFFPESPRYLLSQGDEEGALEVFRRIYASNTGRPVSQYPFTNLELDDDMLSTVSHHSEKLFRRIKRICHRVGSQSKLAFGPAVRRSMILMIIINFAIQFGYYGLWLWFPELFNRLQVYYEDHNVTVSVCEVVDFKPNTTGQDPFEHCKDAAPPDNQVFINAFIVAIAPLPANIWTIFHMDKLGRKFFLVFSMIGSGLAAFLIWLVRSSAGNLALSCIFGAVSTMGFNALDCLGAELFPTNVRSTAMSITLAAARLGAILGNIIFGVFVDVACAIPILLVATLLMFGGLLGLWLPNTTKEPLL
ncbi:synaptic vesicle glycoprotein 2C isoform X1 [Daphnia magna]|uniref:Synaptic vesicle glycoprotein 2B n=2 Tax=Daphnia magna TaxID=35525 RepID=A0A164MNG6_9CRUS|nr:synaptic vesicle glycoprotein 2C isoform X1 [Daphnia magna]XP_045030098.1 synaptic vesicle glycoprotein 2C isoform X1 [Daphnia magna]XP_045030100.1 synaptic vesicle glycoprotein 2C isoform X1 [Daphnia magna]KAK4008982.1 hypothetical protein OUZ56_014100 [Daphnia magna]KZS05212.1 Synaptic vesicle glycoprotein 2B [Daphnia magna]